MLKRILIVLIVGLIFVSKAEAKWYKVRIHWHSPNSDGVVQVYLMLQEARSSGIDAVLITDHLDSLAKGGEASFEKYYHDFSGTNPLVITACEITSDQGGNHHSHLLALGKIPYDKKLIDLQFGNQQAIVDRVRELGLLAVAAHPSLQSTYNYSKLYKGEYFNFSFDKSATRGLNGLEVGNDGDFGDNTLLWYLDLLRTQDAFITSGCDDHAGEKKRLARITYVWIDGPLTKESLLGAIANGQTYASLDGTEAQNINIIPGFRARKGFAFVVCTTVKFKSTPSKPVTMRLFRDGNTLIKSINYPAGKTSYQFYGFDAPSKGIHKYVFEVVNHLITSPINVNVNKWKLSKNNFSLSYDHPQGCINISKKAL